MYTEFKCKGLTVTSHIHMFLQHIYSNMYYSYNLIDHFFPLTSVFGISIFVLVVTESYNVIYTADF